MSNNSKFGKFEMSTNKNETESAGAEQCDLDLTYITHNISYLNKYVY